MICPSCKGKKLRSNMPVECSKCASTGSVPDGESLEDLPEEPEDGFSDDEVEEV